MQLNYQSKSANSTVSNLKLPLDKPIPYDLITRIVKVRVKQKKARKVARSHA